ncbi:fasciclin-3 isoform X2 [Solenopsis invicta]|uniref:fasciclin-3 isoform X2 n=1 Tax=Solenopsis invicta TaxID=13686 RepID=UPI0005958EC4|nr:fasciclin-3 isoform X2 [Solenopsis invicta]
MRAADGLRASSSLVAPHGHASVSLHKSTLRDEERRRQPRGFGIRIAYRATFPRRRLASTALTEKAAESPALRRSPSRHRVFPLCSNTAAPRLRDDLKLFTTGEFGSRTVLLFSVMCPRATTSGHHARMTTIAAWTCVVAVLCSSIVEAKNTNTYIDIEPKKDMAVRVGESVQILCKADQPLRVCRVEIPGEGSIVFTGTDPAEDGIEYYGTGLNTGQCGVQIARVKDTHDGTFKCSLTTIKARQEATASLKIIVARPPNNPDLRTNRGSVGVGKFRKGEKLEVSCSAPSGRPAANVSLFLDEEPIGDDRNAYNPYNPYVEDNLSVQNASRSLDWTDNGKTLRCIASHIALDRPKESTMQLEVYYPPQPHQTFERFGYVIGRQGIINITIFAHPRPRFTWRVNNEKIDEGRPDESNRLETSTAVDLGKGAWSVILTIDSVQKSDTEKEYVLEAHNVEGSYEYRIVLSTSSEPAGVDLDAGSIIGIVVGVLVLVLIIFLVIFARATGRWCFAGHSTTRNLGESDFADPATGVSLLHLGKSKTTADVVRKRSDTESAGRYSRSEVDGSSSRGQRRPRINLSRLFGKNKDKVSGTDTDTMKTVVTIDDEKLQTVEPAVQESRTNPPTGEGGIVYAELDLTQQQQGVTPRRVNEDKTEYAEILYTKPETEETAEK